MARGKNFRGKPRRTTKDDVQSIYNKTIGPEINKHPKVRKTIHKLLGI